MRGVNRKIVRWSLEVVVGLWCILGIAQMGFSDEVGRGGYAGSFLRMGLGARAMAMGGGSVALVDDGYATYYNPAGLVSLEGHWFTTTLHSMALDRRLFYAGYAQAVGGKRGLMRGGFSAGWLCAGVDRIDARDFNGNDTGSLSSWEHCFFFSFALQPASSLSIGLSGKVLYHRFPGITDGGESLSATGLGFDVGLVFTPVHFLTLGLTVKDLRSRYTWENTQKLWPEEGSQTVDAFPRVVRGGVAVRALSNRVVSTFDLEKVEYWSLGYRIGIQVEGYRGVFLRGGVLDGEPTFGTGYRVTGLGKFIQLDYGFVPDPVAPRGNHVFTWSFIF